MTHVGGAAGWRRLRTVVAHCGVPRGAARVRLALLGLLVGAPVLSLVWLTAGLLHTAAPPSSSPSSPVRTWLHALQWLEVASAVDAATGAATVRGRPARWPVVCPAERDAPPAARPREHVNLSALGMEPALDLMVDPLHATLTVLGVHRRHHELGNAVNLQTPFWCDFGGGDLITPAVKLGPDDKDLHIFLRTCPIPDPMRQRLDDGEPVAVTLTRPFATELDDRTASAILRPHPERCPAAVRRRLAAANPEGSPPLARTAGWTASGLASPRPPLARGPHAYAMVGCTMTRSADGDERLVEWIEYHRMQGFEHMYIYHHHPPLHAGDDLQATSPVPPVTDAAETARLVRAFERLLAAYVNAGVVTVVDWPAPDTTQHPWLASDRRLLQIAANNHCMAMYGDLAEWLVVFDLDEFILPLAANLTVLETVRAIGLQPHESHISLRMWLYRNQTNGNPNSTAAAAPPSPAESTLSAARWPRAHGLRSQTWVYRTANEYPNSRNKLIVRSSAVGTTAMHRVSAPRSWPRYADRELRLCHFRHDPWPDDGMPEFESDRAHLVLDHSMHRYGRALQARVDSYLAGVDVAPSGA